jgi:hypothetical protein
LARENRGFKPISQLLRRAVLATHQDGDQV